jgi:hypothetical protein
VNAVIAADRATYERCFVDHHELDTTVLRQFLKGGHHSGLSASRNEAGEDHLMAVRPPPKLVISRQDQEAGKRVEWEVVVDDCVITTVKNGQRVELTISAGTHSLNVRASSRKASLDVLFEVADGAFLELAASAYQSRINKFGRLWRGSPNLRVEQWGPGTTFTEQG